MGEFSQVEHAGEQVAADVAAYVKAHPAYAQIVEALGIKALQALAAEAGIAI